MTLLFCCLFVLFLMPSGCLLFYFLSVECITERGYFESGQQWYEMVMVVFKSSKPLVSHARTVAC